MDEFSEKFQRGREDSEVLQSVSCFDFFSIQLLKKTYPEPSLLELFLKFIRFGLLGFGHPFLYEKLLVMLVNMHITKLQKWDSTDAIRM